MNGLQSQHSMHQARAAMPKWQAKHSVVWHAFIAVEAMSERS